MEIQELFVQRDVVAKKLKECIRDLGYTKISFSEKTGISRQTIEELLNANVDDQNTFEQCMQKILAVLDFTVEDLMFFSTQPKSVDVMSFQNNFLDYDMSQKAINQYDLLLDLVALCTIYY